MNLKAVKKFTFSIICMVVGLFLILSGFNLLQITPDLQLYLGIIMAIVGIGGLFLL